MSLKNIYTTCVIILLSKIFLAIYSFVYFIDGIVKCCQETINENKTEFLSYSYIWTPIKKKTHLKITIWKKCIVYLTHFYWYKPVDFVNCKLV